jgi:hypothetical protein
VALWVVPHAAATTAAKTATVTRTLS